VFVLSVDLTLAAIDDLGWSWTLLLGVACASAIIRLVDGPGLRPDRRPRQRRAAD
jgi:hypothetical protein